MRAKAAAVLVVGGGAEEERYFRVDGCWRWENKSVDYCTDLGG